MLAEEELNFIFCKSKQFGNSSRFNYATAGSGLSQQWSSSTNASSLSKGSDSLSQATISNFDLHLEVPLERPSCNPFTKEGEEFMIINPSYDVVEAIEFSKDYDAAGLVPCDTQVLY
jgi:hypothetical protein